MSTTATNDRSAPAATPEIGPEAGFRLHAIPAEAAAALRRRGGEVYVADAVPGYPCRRCLRDAEIGEELLLVSHDPFDVGSPYRSASPIFLHRDDCGGPAPEDHGSTLPIQLTRRRLSVRAFDDRAMMIDAAVIDGADLESTINDFFGHETAVRIHVHNAERGCWAATITRP